jgi:hypothetical protein
MVFRRLMIRNLHFLKRLSDEIVNELICCMEVKRFAKNSIILKSGDVCNVRFLENCMTYIIETKLYQTWRN